MKEQRFAYPVMLDLTSRLVVVVGAGAVGQRKLEGVLRAGGRVRLIDPLLAGKTWPDDVEIICRCFADSDLEGAELVFACSDSAQANQQVTEAARRHGVLCCRTDLAGGGDFALPAVLRRGDLTLAVSTGGNSPALAAAIRDRLDQLVPDAWAEALALIGDIREKRLTSANADQYNQQVLHRLFTEQLLSLFEQGKDNKVDQLIKDHLTEGNL